MTYWSAHYFLHSSVMLTAGILFLVAGLYMTRMTWRADIEPYGRRQRLFQIAMHPEQFAKPDRLGQIRVLNLIGFKVAEQKCIDVCALLTD